MQFDGLFRRLYPPLFFYARGIVGTDADAEDVVEDVFVELWKRHTEVEWGEQIEEIGRASCRERVCMRV